MRPLECEAPRLFTRAQVLALLKIGETTLWWLQQTGKLKPIRIGARVLFPASEIERLAMHGATLTEAEKEAAAKRNASSTASHRGGRARAPEAPARQPRRGDACSP
jgi:Helix-turn-helix domain